MATFALQLGFWNFRQRSSWIVTIANRMRQIFWCNPTGQIGLWVRSAHKKGQMPLNVQPTSACNSGSTFPSGASFLFHSVSLSIFLEKFVKGDLCDNVDFKVRVITFEGQCFPKWYDSPRYLLFLFPFLYFSTFLKPFKLFLVFRLLK
jgi:hypothetical protein